MRPRLRPQDTLTDFVEPGEAMRCVLTTTHLESVKPPAVGRVEIADLRCAGLSYRVTAAGARSWCYRFRDPATGKTTRATIGSYPAVTLAKARSRAETLRREVQGGINPVAARRQARAEADSKTFQALAERYLAEHARRRKKPKSVEEDDRNLRLHLLPAWGNRPYGGIQRRDVIEVAERLVT
ncbi:MAG: Arm DNA-binding domain-containing protein, partial [Rhodoplanes sp.]